MVEDQGLSGRIGFADRAGRASPLNRLRRFRLAVLIPCAVLAACSPAAGDEVPPESTAGLNGAKLNIWTDPESGCRYFVYREGFAQAAVGSLSIRYRRDGTPDCPRKPAEASNG